jgi:CheY-like chemotaxis protein
VHVHFAVSDTGIGLSPAAQSRLFHPFTQADSSMARKFGGTGLGLAISKRLVEVMGGAIGVESAEGQGSTFWFSVPLRRVVAPMPPQVNHLGKLRVLVVDTNATHREIMQRYLAAWQLRSTAVASAEEALVALEEAALADPFHVAVLDFELPGMDGRALARVVTQNPALAQTRLIMHTGLDAPIRRREAFDAGFVGYLTKPTKMSPLLDAIVSAVGKEPPSILAPALENDAAGGASPAAASEQMILLAEDNPVNQKLALLQLRKLGYQADVVSNGRDAVTAICASQYALVLMDCQMPELDGFGATAAIREAEARSGGRRLPIVAMTANAMQGDREACLAAGMDDYIAKPVRIDELRDVIARWNCVTAEEEQVGQLLP